MTLPAIGTVFLVKDPAGHPRYPLLTMLAKAVLIINYSNVDSERLSVSQYGLSKTKHRNRLGIVVTNVLQWRRNRRFEFVAVHLHVHYNT